MAYKINKLKLNSIQNSHYFIISEANVEEDLKEVVTMRQLLECGVHFGHQTKRWNPKMKKYIFTSRNGIHVIDLQQSMQLINVAYEFVKEIVKNDGTILFVGTKKQAQDAVKEESERSEMPFVNFRWLGGTLTNISTIRQSINKLKDFEKLKESGDFDLLSKKEQSKKTKLYNKLTNMFFGIKSMIKVPSAIFIIDTQKEQLAIKEAKKLNIPIIGVVDTNANPQEIDYPIPANDDAIRAVKLICSIIADAAVSGQSERIVNSASEEGKEREEEKVIENSKEDNKPSDTEKVSSNPVKAEKEDKSKKSDNKNGSLDSKEDNTKVVKEPKTKSKAPSKTTKATEKKSSTVSKKEITKKSTVKSKVDSKETKASSRKTAATASKKATPSKKTASPKKDKGE
ncbi:30S ribosomal protein S2 [bacterium]|nr:30S ribosomal protein S2 [bacterium]